MTSTASGPQSVRGRVWLPGIDYLIGDEPNTKAYCMYCFYETEWISHLRALRDVVAHLQLYHMLREPGLPFREQRG